MRDNGGEQDIDQAQEQVACDDPESSPPHARGKRPRIASRRLGIDIRNAALSVAGMVVRTLRHRDAVRSDGG